MLTPQARPESGGSADVPRGIWNPAAVTEHDPQLSSLMRRRCDAETVISIGEGVGGALLTVRISADFADNAGSGLRLARMAPTMAQLHGITAVHVGQLVPEITRVETAETRLRPPASTIEYSFALLVEGIGVSELEATAPDVIGHLKNTVSGTYETDVYRLAYLLEPQS